MPKTISTHPGVEEVLDGESQSFDYKYHVWLKADWRFSSGRMAHTRTGNFNTVADFLRAKPIKDFPGETE